MEDQSRDVPFSKSDCSAEAEAFNRSIRPELSGCGHEPMVIGSSLSPPRIFFTLWVGGIAQNVPHVLFEADVARHSVRRLLTEESGIEDFTLSPSGRYLAFSVGWASGVCHNSSSVFVADLGRHPTAMGSAVVAKVDRASPSMLATPYAGRQTKVWCFGNLSLKAKILQTISLADTNRLH